MRLSSWLLGNGFLPGCLLKGVIHPIDRLFSLLNVREAFGSKTRSCIFNGTLRALRVLQKAVVRATVTHEPHFTFTFPYLSLDLLQYARTLLNLKFAQELRRSLKRFRERPGKGMGFWVRVNCLGTFGPAVVYFGSLNVHEDFLGSNPSGLLHQYA